MKDALFFFRGACRHGLIGGLVLVLAGLIASDTYASEKLFPGTFVKAAWSNDSRYVVYQETDFVANPAYWEDGAAGDEEDPEELLATVRIAHVVDVQTLTRESFIVTVEGKAPADSDLGRRLKKLKNRKEFDAWVKVNPLTPMESKQVSADGKTTATLFAEANALAWTGSTYNFESLLPAPATEEDDGDERPWLLSLHLKKNGVSWPTWKHRFSGEMGALGPDKYNAHLGWSPNGLWIVAFLNNPSWVWMRGPIKGHHGMHLARTGPRVSVMANKAIPKEVREAIVNAALAQGFAAVDGGPSLKDRADNVVFATAGLEAEAKQIAALLPGGATVQKLNWDADVELVVALGTATAKDPES